jgi:hypothetical protein
MYSDGRPNTDRSPESLEARLRALPQPPVPADLEARLLATIPGKTPIPQRRWGVWVGAVAASAAACLLAVLAWPGRDGKNPVPSPGTRESVHQVTVPSPSPSPPTSVSAPALGAGLPTPALGAGLLTPPTLQPPDDSASIAPWLQAGRDLDGADTPTFTWPLEETLPMRVSTSIPSDLLD